MIALECVRGPCPLKGPKATQSDFRMSWLWRAVGKLGSCAEYYLAFGRNPDAWCSKCGAAISERWDRVAGSRLRCPNLRCRNNTRALDAKSTMAGSSGLEVYDMLRWGNRRLYGVWGQDGWEFFRIGQRWQMLRRSFDKLKDKYNEEIRDRTGKIIKTVEEPLSKHRGHGSAKKMPRRSKIARGKVRADHNFAVAIRDGADLFLCLRIRRAPKGDVYVVHPTGRTDRELKKWNPHESHHRDGRVHHKSFDKKLSTKQSQKPDLDYKGTENLITRPIARGEPRAFGVLCNRGDFCKTMEVQDRTLSSKKYETYVSVDLTEPGGQPILIPGAKITAQQIFDDSIPNIVVTFYEWHQ